MPRPTSHWLERPLIAALIAQGAGTTLALAVRLLAGGLWPSSVFAFAGLQGIAAALASRLLGAPWWWVPIHLAFLPLAFWMRGLSVAPGWYLGAFALLLLVYGRTDRSRVPLYLSNRITADAVAEFLPREPATMIDLGCGDASLLRTIARARPDCSFVGIEHAPLTWAYARLRTIGHANIDIRYGDFWRCDLGQFDLVYAFLSPVPMSALWIKAREEMRAHARLVSNSFAVSEVDAESVQVLDDRRATRLLCYRPARHAPKQKAHGPAAPRA